LRFVRSENLGARKPVRIILLNKEKIRIKTKLTNQKKILYFYNFVPPNVNFIDTGHWLLLGVPIPYRDT